MIPATVVVAVMGVMTACGLSTNQSPETLSRDALPDELGGTANGADIASEEPLLGNREAARLWFVTAGHDGLVLVSMDDWVVRDATEMAALERLFSFSADRLSSVAMRSAIPPDVMPNNVERRDNVVVVDLPEQFFDSMADGDGRLAMGQIVLTLTDHFSGVSSVVILKDGVREPVRLGDGSESERNQPLTRSDYIELVEAPASDSEET